ncbi:Nse1 non-SMC component of SMC5-6 complex-domain-containing protein [Hypoxylon fuscum]|nr:Nse1 non-SMC component of SMC5-6 complex-domain-containing protein [Hypoxylon fuscum]
MDEDEIAHPYNDSNRAFLQAFLARGTMTFKESQPILASIFTAQDQLERGAEAEATRADQVTREDFQSYVSAASAAVSPLDMEIRSATHQVTRERVYALVNTTSDAPTQLATLHGPEEIAFARRLVDALFDTYNTPRAEALCLDGMQANKLRKPARGADDDDSVLPHADGENAGAEPAGALKGLKPSEVETALRRLVDEGWLERSRAGFYSLAPRALVELRAYLVDAFNDADEAAADPRAWQRVKFCEACREIVTVGLRCAERDCNVRLHDGCADKFWRARGEEGGRTCPRCSTAWTGRDYVGERAVTETPLYQRGRRKSGKGRERREQQVVVEEEEMEDAQGDEE